MNRKYIPVSGKVFGREEIDNAIEVAKEGWWTEGRYSLAFEAAFKKFLDTRFVTLVNSGSSANLVALATLTSAALGDRQLKAGDEFITTAVAFPTTVNPGLLYGLKPIFIDAEVDSLNIDAHQIEAQITKKTKLIMLAHTLGKPFNLDIIVSLCKKYNLWLIEDCCDALGSTHNGRHVGSFGDLATYSFYPAHQMTMGEGGAVITNNPLLHKTVRQFRDWGRDCWCPTGKDNTCQQRFKWKLGNLPMGYDHKYIYSQIGFNLKLTDFQAAIGLAQIKRLPRFIEIRQRNYFKLDHYFRRFQQYFIVMNKDLNDSVSYFGYPLVIKKTAPFTRNQLTEYYASCGIGTRNVFSGNLLRHPAYVSHVGEYKIVGDMQNADLIMNNAFWLGVYPGIKVKDIMYITKMTDLFLNKYL